MQLLVLQPMLRYPSPPTNTAPPRSGSAPPTSKPPSIGSASFLLFGRPYQPCCLLSPSGPGCPSTYPIHHVGVAHPSISIRSSHSAHSLRNQGAMLTVSVSSYPAFQHRSSAGIIFCKCGASPMPLRVHVLADSTMLAGLHILLQLQGSHQTGAHSTASPAVPCCSQARRDPACAVGLSTATDLRLLNSMLVAM